MRLTVIKRAGLHNLCHTEILTGTKTRTTSTKFGISRTKRSLSMASATIWWKQTVSQHGCATNLTLFNLVANFLRFVGKVLRTDIPGRSEAERIENEHIAHYEQQYGKRPRGNPIRRRPRG